MDNVQTLSLALQTQIGSGPGLTATGAWAIGTAYVPNNTVTRNGSTYVNVLANTGSDPATDGGVHWVLANGATLNGITALSSAVLLAANALVQSRLARRVGILTAAINPAQLPCGTTVGQIAGAWNEVLEAGTLAAAAAAADSALAPLRANEPAVRFALCAGYTEAQLNAMAGVAIADATDYETLLVEVLPA
jgi:hypothetical protein